MRTSRPLRAATSTASKPARTKAAIARSHAASIPVNGATYSPTASRLRHVTVASPNPKASVTKAMIRAISSGSSPRRE